MLLEIVTVMQLLNFRLLSLGLLISEKLVPLLHYQVMYHCPTLIIIIVSSR